jgi:dienelactone hydrolase
VRRGNIVIYPRYQANRRTPTRDFAPNAIQAVKEAIRTLQGEGHVKPELEKFAIVGHSAGGQTTANMAALAVSSGLPEPKAVMSVQPGKSWNISERIQIPLENLSSIPSKTLLLAVVGDKDRIARDVDAKRIFNETPQIPKANKNYVILVSDDHGEPPLIANHFCPVAVDDRYDSGESTEKRPGLLTRLREALRPKKAKGRDEEAERGAQGEDEDVSTVKDGSRTLNALDYYGLWKLFDGLCDAAFYGKNREYALGNTPQQRFMGKWSDGLPVKELLVLDSP